VAEDGTRSSDGSARGRLLPLAHAQLFADLEFRVAEAAKLDERRRAGAFGTDQGGDLAGANGEVDALKGRAGPGRG